MTKCRALVAAAAVLLAAFAAPAGAALRVLACEPEWAALTRELGGARVEVASATTPMQDPHRIEARPSLVARARNADLIVCSGAELEAGWLPALLEQSGNEKIQPGRPGHFMAADFVRMLEIPAQLDRSQGDVHAAGNPHIHTAPGNVELVAQALAERLRSIDPVHAGDYAQRYASFQQRWREATSRWSARAAPLKGVLVVSQHKAFVYLYEWLGLKEAAVLEPKPGVEPSPSHLQQVLARVKQTQPRMVLYAAYQNPRPSEWLSRQSGIPAVKLPFTVGGTEAATDLFGLFDDTLSRLLAASVKP